MKLESTWHSDIKLVIGVVVGNDTFHKWRQVGKCGSFRPPTNAPSFTCQTNNRHLRIMSYVAEEIGPNTSMMLYSTSPQTRITGEMIVCLPDKTHSQEIPPPHPHRHLVPYPSIDDYSDFFSSGFFSSGFFASVFFASVFSSGFFSSVFFASVFFDSVFLASDFLASDFLGAAFFVAAFLAASVEVFFFFSAAGFFTVDAFLVTAFFVAEAFLVGVFLADEVFFATVVAVVAFFLGAAFFFGALVFLAAPPTLFFFSPAAAVVAGFVATVFFTVDVFFTAVVFFVAVAVFLGITFLGLGFGLLASTNFFLHSALNLNDCLFWTKSPALTPSLSALRNMAFIHFLSEGRSACMCFLMAIMEEPVRWSLREEMALMIPAL
mmetsp:Transcript_30990/g.64251  ORF Transcript_30990/g.64251 Transcript_30990/m.64251 type:complete len:378 (-) Transcript_30990:405-1538(-)